MKKKSELVNGEYARFVNYQAGFKNKCATCIGKIENTLWNSLTNRNCDCPLDNNAQVQVLDNEDIVQIFLEI
jgi:hypothetical protein